MLRLRRHDDPERGQMLPMFALIIVVIMLFASIAVDLGVLRNTRQTLINTLDSAALAGATKMPVTGATEGAAATALIETTVTANFRDLPRANYTIEYKCLIGVDGSGTPLIARDITFGKVCDPTGALGHAPLVGDFQGAGPTRYSICDPMIGDKCNVVVITGEATTDYSFGRVVGIDKGWTGDVVSAACNGPCGLPPFTPLDIVVIIDRTGSMGPCPGSNCDIPDLKAAAQAVLKVYDPNIQHVALGVLGPSSLTRMTWAGDSGYPATDCTGFTPPAYGIALDPGAYAVGPPPVARSPGSSVANSSSGASSIVIPAPPNTAAGDLLVAGITIDAGSSANISPPAGSGWNSIWRTNNGTNVGMASYWKIATVGGGSYTWNITGTNRRAAGGIIAFTGANSTNPINVWAGATGNDTSSPFRATAPTVTTTSENTALAGFYGFRNDVTFTSPAALAEQFDVMNTNTNGPSTEGATAPKVTIGSTGTTFATGTAGGQWVAQMIAINPLTIGAPDVYGTDTVADLTKWIPVGLTGTGAPVDQPYVNVDGSLNAASTIVKAIDCLNMSGTGTNLATPIAMARAYLNAYGRPGVRKGIIFETDGTPNHNGSGALVDYTCGQAITNADGAKLQADPIEIFTIGFDVAGQDCPNNGSELAFWRGRAVTEALATIASGPINGNSDCTAAENTDGDHFFCEADPADLEAIFEQAALELAGLRSHLVKLYPVPVVSGVASAGLDVTITGKFFTGATSVTFGGAAAASFTVVSDTSITATAVAGSPGAIADIRVTTPGGTSPNVPADNFTYP